MVLRSLSLTLLMVVAVLLATLVAIAAPPSNTHCRGSGGDLPCIVADAGNNSNFDLDAIVPQNYQEVLLATTTASARAGVFVQQRSDLINYNALIETISSRSGNDPWNKLSNL